MELLAEVLFARLTDLFQTTLNIEVSKIWHYSDSIIVLSWLQIDPCQLETFLGNRTAKIRELSDVISRGATAWELYD